jgi:hypothetical protein
MRVYWAMNSNYDSRADTLTHIKRVNELLLESSKEIITRALDHDKSKLLEPEKAGFDAVSMKLKDMKYGSSEYKAALDELKPILEHHYANNSHHPEHFDNGISGMDLFDVLEMLMDWKAATERMDRGNIRRSVEINQERFAMAPQLVSIINNTIDRMGW